MGRPSARKNAKPTHERPPADLRARVVRTQRALVDLLIALPPLDLRVGAPWTAGPLASREAPRLSAEVHGIGLLEAILPHYVERDPVTLSPEAIPDVLLTFRADNFQRLLQSLLFRRYPTRTRRRFAAQIKLNEQPSSPWEELAERLPKKGDALSESMVAAAVDAELRQRATEEEPPATPTRAELDRRVRMIARLIQIAFKETQSLETAERTWRQELARARRPNRTIDRSDAPIDLDALSPPVCYVAPSKSTATLARLLESEPVVVVVGPSKVGKLELARSVARSFATQKNVPAWFASASRAVAVEQMIVTRPPGVLVMKVDQNAEPGVGSALSRAADMSAADRLILVMTETTAQNVGLGDHSWPMLRHGGFSQEECEEFLFSYADVLPGATDTLREQIAVSIEGLCQTLVSPLAATHFLRRAVAADSFDILALAAVAAKLDSSLTAEFAHCTNSEKVALSLLSIFRDAASAREVVRDEELGEMFAVGLRRFRWALVDGRDDFELHAPYRGAVLRAFHEPINHKWCHALFDRLRGDLATLLVTDEETAVRAASLVMMTQADGTLQSLSAVCTATETKSRIAAAAYWSAGTPSPDHAGNFGVALAAVASWIATLYAGKKSWRTHPEQLLAFAAASSLECGEIDAGLAAWALLGGVGLPLAAVARCADTVFSHYLPHVWRASRPWRDAGGGWSDPTHASIYLARTHDCVALLPLLLGGDGRIRLVGLPLLWTGGECWHEGSALRAMSQRSANASRLLDAGLPMGAWGLQTACRLAFLSGDRSLAIALILAGALIDEGLRVDVSPVTYSTDDEAGGVWAVRDGALVYERARGGPHPEASAAETGGTRIIQACQPSLRRLGPLDFRSMRLLGEARDLPIPPVRTENRTYRARPVATDPHAFLLQLQKEAHAPESAGLWLEKRRAEAADNDE